MSAFLVTEQTMANLAETLCCMMNNPNIFVYYNTSRLRDVLKDCMTGPWHEYKENLVGRKLFAMNNLALQYRYGDDEWWMEDVDKEKEYVEFKNGKNLYYTDKFQFLKSLKCYLYQCCEGAVPESDLYKELRSIEKQIMADIISHMKEFEEAQWG